MKIEGNYQYSKPNFIEKPYGWVQHIPFAFYLIERLNPTIFVELGTHSGNSYFSFCQAVEELKFDTKCYAVDTWEGDEHANFYDKEVFQRVKRINAENFSRNSSLLKMTFDDALTYFSEGSVDLLHIDGLHTYKAVKHDFETWLPKMSKNGVMIFHDTNVRERGFGVWKFFEEVREMYPSFDFLHGNGLGVLCVGEKVDKGFSSFISSPENQADTRNLFSTLGNRILVLQEKEDLRKEVDAAMVIQKDSQKILEKVNLEKEKSTRLASQLQDHKIAIEKKNEKIVEIENKIKSEKEAINKLLNQLNEYKNTVANKNEKIGKLDLTLKKFEDTIAHKNSKITLFEEKIQEFKETVQKRNSKIEVLLSKIEDLRSSIDSKNDRILIQQQKIGEFDRTVAKRNDKIEKLEQRQIEIERLLSEVQEKNNALIQVEEALRIEIEQKDSVIQSRERNSDNLNQLLQAKNSEICEIGKENKHYQEKTVQQQKEILLLLQEVKALKSEIGSKSEAISELELKSQLLGNRLEKTSENVETLTQKSNKFIRLAQERKERIIAYKLTVERREDKIEKLSRQVEQFRKEARSRSNQQEKLVQKLDHAKFVIKSLTNSFSWKITMPLRFIGKVIRFIFGILVLLAKITLFTVTFRFGKTKKELRIIKHKRIIRKSGLFDIDWYLMRYPDVRKVGIDPIVHYLQYGALEGRNPNSSFDSNAYLEHYSDVVEAGINPLVHYVLFGKKEGRILFQSKKQQSLKIDPINGIKQVLNPDYQIAESELLAKVRLYNSQKNSRKAKVVVYTAIIGGYDIPIIPETIVNEWDYVLFTETEILGEHVFEIRKSTYQDGDPTRVARYIKTHPHEFFPKH
ncbi:MAG: class I SAM-dependent methyltransferase, partial [Salinivirgaceae bacterium]|nr:class I SAM-dependent methyltransferase [Salinivirgaceae bacterium]